METTNRITLSKRDLRIKVLGVGGAGCTAVAHLAREPLAGVSFAVVNTDAAALGPSPVEERLLIGSKTCRGLGAGGDLERGRAAAEEDALAVRALTQEADLVFVVAGLGGGTGSGASPVIARIARECNALVLGVVMTPFQFEGIRRQQQANFALQELKTVADATICMPNQKLLKQIDEKTPLPAALNRINAFVGDAVRSIWTLLTRTGIVQVDFASLCAVTQGRYAESCLALGRASGENRAVEAVEMLLAHPLIDEGALLTDATTALVSIAASPGLAMGEVHTIMERISSVAHSAHIVMGAVIEDAACDRLTITLIAGRGESEIAAAARLGVSPTLTEGEDDGPIPIASSRPAAKPPSVVLEKHEGVAMTRRKSGQRLKQTQLPLEIISRGRFEKSEPTIHHGQDLDVPTYIRRGISLN
jgi:cell division protein FtsZ